MDTREYKDAVYSEISTLVKAFSNSNRLEILDFLSNGEKYVEEIAIETGISIANASQHLQTLRKERLVRSRKEGVYVSYALASSEVYTTWKALRSLSINTSLHLRELIADQQKQFPNGVSVPFSEISNRKDVVLVDLRPVDEYNQSHFKNAISIPSDELKERLDELPQDKVIVTYCRGMFCSFADRAIDFLKSKGYMAKKIVDHPMDTKTNN